MRRTELQEIHDHPRFPSFLRDLVTEALQSLWEFGNSYKPILSRLLLAMERAETHEVLDLCSGGGGPWLRLSREAELHRKRQISIRLTDKYPNLTAFSRASRFSRLISFESVPVDATKIPAEFDEFRTIFSSFHHFGPEPARLLLEGSMRRKRGIGVFEVACRSPLTILTICVIPALSWWLALGMRPFRWERLLWTYLIPVVPFVLFYDGMVSCFRAYSREELEELVRRLNALDFRWEVGEERSGFLPVTYVLGYPVRSE